MIDVLQWIAIGLLCVSTLLLLSLLGKHDRRLTAMAKVMVDAGNLVTWLANALTGEDHPIPWPEDRELT